MIFSVVIPTYQRNDLLALCLSKLDPSFQTFSSESYEVIVTDDGKSSTAEKMIRESFPWAKWVSGPKKGPAANRNNGAKYAKGEWLVFTDDDCIPAQDILEKYAKAIEQHPQSLAFEGAIEHVGDAVNLYNEAYECPINTTGGNFWSANICIANSVFRKIEGFDEQYPHAALEDQDIHYRLLIETDIPFIRDCIVHHPFKKVDYKKKISRIPLISKDWSYHALKHRKHFGYQGKWDVLKDSVFFYLKDIVRQMRKGKRKVIAYDLAYLLVGHLYLTYYLYTKK